MRGYFFFFFLIAAWLAPSAVFFVTVLFILLPLQHKRVNMLSELEEKRALQYSGSWLDSVIGEQQVVSRQGETLVKYYQGQLSRMNTSEEFARFIRRLFTEQGLEVFLVSSEEKSRGKIIQFNARISGEGDFSQLLDLFQAVAGQDFYLETSQFTFRGARGKIQFAISLVTYVAEDRPELTRKSQGVK